MRRLDSTRRIVLLGLALLYVASCDGTPEWSDHALCGHGLDGVSERWPARIKRNVREEVVGWECRLADAPQEVGIVDKP